MNYLAHCFLAQANSESMVGNLLGDFAKGLDESTLSEKTYLGLMDHREVDRFTDANPQVLAAKRYFSGQRRRFAGIALDVLFDHFLIKNWHLYSDIAFPEFKRDTYQLIEQGQYLMPYPMQQVMRSVVKNDWFASYETIEGIGFALDRIAMRIRFSNKFSGSIEDIEQHYPALETAFRQFFPQLLSFNQTRLSNNASIIR